MPVLEERRNFSRMERKITENSRLKKGFTLAELLIVVAIIAVLVAIGIPIFTSQLEKSREAVDLSEVRSAYAEVMMAALTGDTNATYTKDGSKIYLSSGDYQITVQPLKQKQDGWQTKTPLNIGGVSSEAGQPYWIGVPAANGYCKITYHVADDYVSFEWSGAADSGNNGNNSNGNSSGNNTSNGTTPSFGAAKEMPEELKEKEIFSIDKGYIYQYNGKKYVAMDKIDYNHHYYVKPGETNQYIELKPDAPIYTSADLKPKDKDRTEKTDLFGLTEGCLYRTDDGKIYMYKRNNSPQYVPPSENDENWQLIHEW